MSIWDRIMLFLTAVLTAVTSAILFLMVRPAYQATAVGTRLHNFIYGNIFGSILLGLIILVIVVYLLILASRPTHTSSSGANSSAGRSIVKPTSMGDVRISLSAIEDLVIKVAKKHPQVKDSAARVGGDIDTLQLNVKVDVYADVVIPVLCEELEKEISEVVQQMIGVDVKAVHFDINSVSGDVVSNNQNKATLE